MVLRRQSRLSLVGWLTFVVLATAWLGGTTPARSQSNAKDAATPSAAKSAEEPLPPEEDVELPTTDDVLLKGTFYPGTRGKDSVPVVLLHMYKGSRKDYARLALFLQKQGHAVLVPDLRGHGDSTQVSGKARPLNARSMSSAEFEPMVEVDLEACKKFLVDKNNAGKLNIEKLCLVGAEMGAVVAIDYARLDWSWPDLVNVKQGKDVKAVVLISPPWAFRSLQMRPALERPDILKKISTLILVGQENKRSLSEAERLYSMLKRFHPSADDKDPAERTLLFKPLPTSLQGTKILDAPELQVPVPEWIAWFIKVRLVDQSIPWKMRTTLPVD